MNIQNSLELGLVAIKTMDLKNIKRKLMEPEPAGQGWSQEQADEAEKWYRRYLEIVLRDQTSAGHVPNHIIDLFWHTHILDTESYARDCQNIFGCFLHHYQYLGMNGDIHVRDAFFVNTNNLYMKFFGESCTSMKHFKNVIKGAMCDEGGANCIGSGCRHHGDTP